MALQSPFFGKREPDAGARPFNTSANQVLAGQRPATATAPTPSPVPVASTPEPEETQAKSATRTPEGGSKLTVGPNIKLKGVEITDCDTLVVEGSVEATMDSRVMQIAEQGAFNGSAQIDIAEIHGAFDGELTVRERLVIHPTGKVSGKVRYGRLVIEEGGQISGDIALNGLSSLKKAA